MNTNYSQQHQHYYNYQQHNPGPPQPSWQATVPQSPSGWQDPRYQSIPPPQTSQYNHSNFQSSQSHHLPYPPPPPGPPSQTTSSGSGTILQPALRPQEQYHGSSTSQYDTSQWGVKYNQSTYPAYQSIPSHSLQPDQRPALPPRPGSSLSQTSSLSSHQHAPSVNSFTPSVNQYPIQGSWNVTSGYSQEQEPPTPPPRPAAYNTPSHYGSVASLQDQCSQHAPTHHYDPISQQQPTWSQSHQCQEPASTQYAWGQAQTGFEGPVSPIRDESRRESLVGRPVDHYVEHEPPSQDVQLPSRPAPSSTTSMPKISSNAAASTAFGGPFDWQHYQASPPSDEVETPLAQAQLITTSPLQTSYSIKRKSVERQRPATNVTSQPSSVLPLREDAEPSSKQAVVTDQLPGQQLQSQSESQPSRQGSFSQSQIAKRQDSRQSNISSLDGVERNDTIDNVIQAWSTPITAHTATQNALPPSTSASGTEKTALQPTVQKSDREVQTDFESQIETKIETRVETKLVEVDRYADIQHQYQATLKRFADMLRQETAAESDKEKFKIFQGFVIRELRLRSVLYGVEAQSPESVVKAEQGRQNELPQAQRFNAVSPGGSIEKQPPQPEFSTQQRQKLEVQTPSTPRSKDESFVMVGSNGEDGEYSPGGRPRMSPLKAKTSNTTDVSRKPVASAAAPPPTTSAQMPDPSSPGANAPMTLDDYVMPDQPSPSADAPILVDSDHSRAPTGINLTGTLNFQPARPLYQPFRYSEGATEAIPTVYVQGPPAESFTTLRHNQAAESGRTLIHDPPPVPTSPDLDRGQTKTPSGGRREHEEAFIGLIRAKSLAIRSTNTSSPRPNSPAILRAGTPMNRSTPSPPLTTVSPLVKSIQSLRSLMPQSLPPQPGPKIAPHPKLEPIDSAARRFIDDFSFIHTRVLAWDKSNRQLRAKQDAERHLRQSKNEEKIDDLFNDNEIGYADIGELEKDFKLEEAGRKFREDQEELDSFTTNVFENVVEKLEREIAELTKLQINAIDILDLESTSAAKQVQASQSSGGMAPDPPISSVMQLLLQIHDKREIRYLKIAEASFERERRRKRLELSVLYTNNDKAGIKKLEAEFAKAEKVQILNEMRKKADRANRILDSFDRAAVKGLAEDQGVMDDVLARLQLIRDLFLGSEENLPQGQAKDDFLYGDQSIKDLMDRTSALTDFIHTDSKSLVELLDKADSLSNNADFEMYMSEAKLAEASPEQFQKLKAEKEVEDRSVDAELTSRLSGMARVPAEILSLVKEVRDKVGADAGHQERINKALEAAKLRNEVRNV